MHVQHRTLFWCDRYKFPKYVRTKLNNDIKNNTKRNCTGTGTGTGTSTRTVRK